MSAVAVAEIRQSTGSRDLVQPLDAAKALVVIIIVSCRPLANGRIYELFMLIDVSIIRKPYFFNCLFDLGMT